MTEEMDINKVREVIMRNDLDLMLLRHAALMILASKDQPTLRDLAKEYLRLKGEQDSGRQQDA